MSQKEYPAPFLYLALTQFIVQLAHSIFDVSILWLALDITGSRFSTGIIIFTAYLPYLLFSIPAGIFADQKSKQHIIKITVWIRIGVALFIPFWALVGQISMFTVALSAFLLTVMGAFFLPARDALIPEYIPPHQLVRGNSVIQGSMQFAFILGPALAGFLIDSAGNVRTFAVISALFLLAGTLALKLGEGQYRYKSSTPSLSKEAVTDIVKLMKNDKRLLWLVLITMIDNLFIMGPAIIGVAIFVKDVLGGSASQYALSESFLAIGMMLTSLILFWRGNRFPMGKMLVIGIFMDGLTYVPVKWIGDIRALWLVIFLHAIFIPFITVSRTTIVQKIVPREMQGRIFAIMSLSVVGFTAISSALTGWLSDLLPVQDIFFFIGLGGALSGVIAVFYRPLWQLE